MIYLLFRRNYQIYFIKFTHFNQVEFLTSINWISPFPFLGLLGAYGIFHFHSNFNRIFCKQTVEALIRRRVMRYLISRCAVSDLSLRCLPMSHEENARHLRVKLRSFYLNSFLYFNQHYRIAGKERGSG